MDSRKVTILSLGCPKNLVDSELILAEFAKKGFEIVEEIAGSDIVIVNTCAFIEDAKKESIDTILDLIQLKKEGAVKKIIVRGCLPQRYGDILRKELSEVDVFKGVRDFKSNFEDKILLTPRHYAYLKISDGCNNKCKYCVISKLRGHYKSKPINNILREVKTLYNDSLGEMGELNLISQDLTYYGVDLYGNFYLARLLRRINDDKATKNLKWIRLLYAHPAHFTDELIGVIKDSRRICKYIDLPLQHINDKLLKAMGRRITKRRILDLIEKLRRNIPGIAIRSSLIVGLPGEGEAEFKELLRFIRDIKFQRLGIFTYSREEGTPAYKFKLQVSDKEKSRRLDEAMRLQQAVSRQVNAGFLGKVLEVLIDEADKKDKNLYIARSYADAPEVDGQVYVKSNKVLPSGSFVNVKITDTLEYDLAGEPV